MKIWTREQVLALGVRIDGKLACEIVYGCKTTKALELLSRGEVDFPVIRRGRQYIVPTAAVLTLLDIPPEDNGAGLPHSPATATSIPEGTSTSDHGNPRRRAR